MVSKYLIFSPAPNLNKLIAYNNPLTNLNLSANMKLSELEVDNSELYEPSVVPELGYYLDVDLPNQGDLEAAVFHNAPLRQIDFSNLPNLMGIGLFNTLISELNLHDNPSINTVALTGNSRLTGTLDLSQVPTLVFFVAADYAVKSKTEPGTIAYKIESKIENILLHNSTHPEFICIEENTNLKVVTLPKYLDDETKTATELAVRINTFPPEGVYLFHLFNPGLSDRIDGIDLLFKDEETDNINNIASFIENGRILLDDTIEQKGYPAIVFGPWTPPVPPEEEDDQTPTDPTDDPTDPIPSNPTEDDPTDPTPTNPIEEIAVPKTGTTVAIVNSLASLIPAITLSSLTLIIARFYFKKKSL